MRSRALAPFVWLSTLAGARASEACPDCPAALAAREEALGDGLATNLVIALAPFIVVALASLWAERSKGHR